MKAQVVEEVEEGGGGMEAAARWRRRMCSWKAPWRARTPIVALVVTGRGEGKEEEEDMVVRESGGLVCRGGVKKFVEDVLGSFDSWSLPGYDDGGL